MKKLCSTARILYTLARIASVCCIVGICLIAAAAVLLFAMDNPSMIEFTGLTLGDVHFRLDAVDLNMIKSSFLCIALPGLVLAGFGYAVIRIILQILKPMREGLPFDSSVSVKLKKLCWLTLGGGITSQLFGAAGRILLYKAFDFSHLFLNERIVGVSVTEELDLTFVVLALIWYMLSCVFRYGEELQRQADETL